MTAKTPSPAPADGAARSIDRRDRTGDAARPFYHYAPAANWLSDPNGLVFADGEWHLFYQYNPHGDLWGHMAWGHAVSADLLDWQELPPALLEDDRHLIFSGSAVIDAAGSAGLGAGALVAIYTGARPGGGHQVQCLASSNDRGRTWTKFAGNPVLDRDLADFRDPNVFWHADTRQWIMLVALSAENCALIYGSDDLKTWRELSLIGPFALAGGVWECPLLIELPVEGGAETRWLFKVDLLQEGPGSGAVALTGTFDGTRFVADRTAEGREEWLIVDHGRDFYAAIAWHAPRDDTGRPCWIGWMGNHAYQAMLPARGWRGAMSLPRRIGLLAADGRYRLVQTVEPAVTDAFEMIGSASDRAIARPLPAAARLVVTHRAAGTCRIAITDAAGASVTIVWTGETIAVERAASIHDAFDAAIAADLMGDELTLWLDVGTLELASADGATWLGLQHCLAGGTLTLTVQAETPVDVVIATPRPR